ncbi:MAG: hypothetical protein AABY32_01995 [Nanoarchaeota archaeon]
MLAVELIPEINELLNSGENRLQGTIIFVPKGKRIKNSITEKEIVRWIYGPKDSVFEGISFIPLKN